MSVSRLAESESVCVSGRAAGGVLDSVYGCAVCELCLSICICMCVCVCVFYGCLCAWVCSSVCVPLTLFVSVSVCEPPVSVTR